MLSQRTPPLLKFLWRCFCTTKSSKVDPTFMKLALRHAQAGFRSKEMPIGTAIVDREGNVIAAAHSKCYKLKDKNQHAELIALRNAVNYFGPESLIGTTLYTTLEPNEDVIQQLVEHKVFRIVYGAMDSRYGCTKTRPEIQTIGHVLDRECEELFKNYNSTVNASATDSSCRGYFNR